MVDSINDFNFSKTSGSVRPVVLLLLDAWGVSRMRDNNAIRLAKIPNFKKLVADYPATVLAGLGLNDIKSYGVIAGSSLQPSKSQSLAQVIASAGKKQLKIAETEKFALVTNFFNLSEEVLNNEEAVLVPAKNLKTTKANVSLASPEVVKKFSHLLSVNNYDFALISLANLDYFSQIGNLELTIKAVEAVDKLLPKIVEAVLARNGVLLITSAHGRAEEVFNLQTNKINHQSTKNPVPFILVGQEFIAKTSGFLEAPGNDLSLVEPTGELIDIAPTILKIMGLTQPPRMMGKSLI